MIDYINKRLNDWARWKVSDRKTVRHTLGVKSCWPQMIGEAESTETVRQHGTLVPLDDLECCDTDKAVCALPDELRAAVIEYYTRIGTADTTAKRLGVSKATLYRSIDQAHLHIRETLRYRAPLLAIAATKDLTPGRAICPSAPGAGYPALAPGSTLAPGRTLP